MLPLADDVKLKLAEHISSDLDLDIRCILLILGKRIKQLVTSELHALINDCLTLSTITCR